MRRTILIAVEFAALFVMLYLFYFGPLNIEDYLSKGWMISLLDYLVYFVIVDLGARIIKWLHQIRHNLKDGQKDNFQFGVENIAKLLIGIGFIVSLFGILGVNFKELITSISIVAAAIAIITKDYLSDYLVGVYFSFSENFEIGDYVKIGEQKGKIRRLEMLKIKLMNDDDDLVIIPNSKVYSSEIINYTKKDIRLMSVDFQLDIKSIKSMEGFERKLKLALVDFDKYIEADSYNLKIVEMKKDYVDFKFQYKLVHIDQDMQREIRKRTVRKIFSYVTSQRGVTAGE